MKTVCERLRASVTCNIAYIRVRALVAAIIIINHMNEKLIERKLREKVKSKGGIALKLYSAYHTGLPDRLVLMPGGKARFAEIKTTGKKPTALQVKAIKELQEMGFDAEVIDNQEKLEHFINTL